MKKILMVIMVVAVSVFGVGMLSPTPVMAGCDDSFLTFPPWYRGLTKADCSLVKPKVDGGVGDIELATFVWIIILNILAILFSLVGYLALGFVIFGGYLYVMARGDSSRIVKGKKTVISALVGLVICILASLAVHTIVTIITEAL